MRKLKKNYLAITIVCLALVSAGVYGVNAYQSNVAPSTVIENVENLTITNEAQAPMAEIVEEELGIAFTDFTSTCTNWNGDERCVYTGDFISASTTLLRIPTPFSTATTTNPNDQYLPNWNGVDIATSTVQNIRLNITTGASTTFRILCGVSTDGYDNPDINLVATTDIATSAIGVIETGVATSSTQGGYGWGTTLHKMQLTQSHPYILCDTDNFGSNADETALSSSSRAFAGDYVVEIRR